MTGLVLTQTRLDELQGYINTGDRESYYEALASWGSDYAELALGVVRNDTLAGRTANNYMAAYADQHNITYNSTIQTQISSDLMLADFSARSEQFLIGNTGELSGGSIQDYHETVLPIYNLPPQAWSLEIGAQYYGDDFRDDALASESGFLQAMNLLFEHTIHPVTNPVESVAPEYTNWLATLYKSAFQAAYDEAQESTPVAAYNFTQGLALGDLEQLANLPPNKIISMIEAIHQINEAVGSTAQIISGIETAANAPPRFGDPLTLDMDKDGQVDLRPLADGRVFDTDEDGFAERVGWVKAEDGMLARDIDSDGLITEQAELFGNQTTSGFTALSVLDSNSDGKIDINDTAFSTLLVWQDANQDGIGQSTELQTLTDAGIKSISLVTTNTNYLVGGNSITKEGSFTWNDNTTSKAFDVNLSIDNFFTRYNEDYELNPMVLTLPTLRGYGNLPDLHIAMSLDSGLLERVKDFSELSLSNYTTVRKAVHDLLIDWANADEKGVHSLYRPQGGSLNSEQIHLLDTFMGANSAFHAGGEKSGLMLDRMMQLYGNRLVFDTFLKEAAPNLNYDVKTDKFQGTVNWGDLIDTMVDLSPTVVQDKVLYWYDMTRLVMEISGNLGINESAYSTLMNTALADVGLGFSYADLRTMNYQTSQGDGMGLEGSNDPVTGQFIAIAHQSSFYDTSFSGYRYSYTEGDDIIIGIPGANSGATGAYLIGGGGNDTIYGTLLDDGLNGYAGNDVLYGGLANDTLSGNQDNDILYGQEGNDSLFGGAENDFLYGGIGNDYLRGDEGSDQIFGEDGDDNIEGGTGKDVIHGGNGNDTIKDVDDDSIYGDDGNDTIIGGGNQIQTVYGGDGNDTIDADTFSITDLYNAKKYFYGEAGNDTLTVTRGINYLDGGTGDDTYLFDYIDNHTTGSQSAYTVTPSGVFISDASGNDQIKFTDTQNQNISLEKFGNDLYVYFGYAYTIKIADQFLDPNNLIIESVYDTFNNTMIDLATWTPTVGLNWTGTASGDGQNGSGVSDFMYGLGGNDSLSGLSGHDYIDGGAGNDVVSGGAQNDILIGGLNNDTLGGGSGNDIYRFQIGDGTDLIQGEEVLESENDVIQFTDGTTWENLNFDYSAYKLDIYYGSSDKISTTHFSVIADGFAGVNAAIVENIKFSNSTTYNITDNVNLFVSYSTINQTFSNEVDIVHGYTNADTINLGEGNDTAKGNTGNDIINGDAGNDWLYGDAGNDTLNGGSGNDKLYGGADNDTYIASGGIDTIIDTGGGAADKIVFGAGITIADLSISRIYGSSYDIVINWTGGNQIRILNAFSSANMIETIQFDDLSTIDLTTYSFTTYGTSIADVMSGLSTNDVMYGYEGNDTLYGYLGNDTLYGGDGNDTINGNEGNDTLYGENGDDRLNGHIGDDTIYGGLGVDTIYAGAGADLIYGGDGGDYVYAEDDNDTVYGDEGNDNLYGMNGNDTIYGGNGDDYLRGDNGDDILFGNDGNDSLYGNAGSNILDGGSGNDNLSGGVDNDTFIYSSGLDSFYEANGVDTLKIVGGTTINDLVTSKVTNNAKIAINAGVDEIIITNQHHATTAYHVERIAFDDGFSTTLEDHLTWTWGTTGNDTLTGTASHNTIIGKAGNDTLDGAGGDDDIHGGSGSDTLYGGDGADLLHGGVDNDILHGGDGLDTLLGGSGADTFTFESTSAFNNVDTIKDFSATNGDALNLSDLLIDFDPMTDLISDFVSFSTSGSNMTLSVDRDGAGATYTSESVTVLENVSGLNVDDLFNNNQIIV